MEKKDALGDRRRALEEDYFRRREQELIEQLKQKAASQALRDEMSKSTGIVDEALLTRLEELGFSPDTIRLLDLIPLLQVAWAEGNVSSQERELILEAARAYGIVEGSAAYDKLLGWLKTKPSESLFETALHIIPAILENLPPEQRAKSHQSLNAYCESIAAASGGLFGLRSVSPEERALLARIAGELEQHHKGAADDVLQGDGKKD